VEWCVGSAEESFSSNQPDQLHLHLQSQGCVFVSMIGPFLAWTIQFRFRNGVGAYALLPASLSARQLSPLHTSPHHSCSTSPPRACLAMHASVGAWTLIVEHSHKSHRYPCPQRPSVSFSSRFTCACDLHEYSRMSSALDWNPSHAPQTCVVRPVSKTGRIVSATWPSCTLQRTTST
jgi:hypothetical protein